MADRSQVVNAIEITRILKALGWGCLGYIIVVIFVAILAAAQPFHYESIAIVQGQPRDGLKAYQVTSATLQRIIQDQDLEARWDIPAQETQNIVKNMLRFEAAKENTTVVISISPNQEDAKDVAEAWCKFSPNFEASPTEQQIAAVKPLLDELSRKQRLLQQTHAEWNYLSMQSDRVIEAFNAEAFLSELNKEVSLLEEKANETGAKKILGQSVLKEPKRAMAPTVKYPIQQVGAWIGYAVFALIVAVKTIKFKPITDEDIAQAESVKEIKKFDF